MSCINKSELGLRQHFRLLWNQHAEWTRMAINAIVFASPNEDAEVNRLLQNPIDLGVALDRFYGEKVAYQFTSLLTTHLQLAAKMIKAMLAGHQAEAEMAKRSWYKNGDEIARFLSHVTPCYSYAEWQEMFFTHLRYVESLATTLLEGRYEANVEVYDSLELEALKMADMMSRCLIMRFPRLFRSGGRPVRKVRHCVDE